jgi:hypothetical protein
LDSAWRLKSDSHNNAQPFKYTTVPALVKVEKSGEQSARYCILIYFIHHYKERE